MGMGIDDVFETGGNVMIGAAVVLAAPLVVSGLSYVAKPLTKATLRGGMLAWGKMKEISAETREGLSDLTAEVRAEMAEAEKDKKKQVTEKKAAAKS